MGLYHWLKTVHAQETISLIVDNYNNNNNKIINFIQSANTTLAQKAITAGDTMKIKFKRKL